MMSFYIWYNVPAPHMLALSNAIWNLSILCLNMSFDKLLCLWISWLWTSYISLITKWVVCKHRTRVFNILEGNSFLLSVGTVCLVFKCKRTLSCYYLFDFNIILYVDKWFPSKLLKNSSASQVWALISPLLLYYHI